MTPKFSTKPSPFSLLPALWNVCLSAHPALTSISKIWFCPCGFVQVQMWPCYVRHLSFLSYFSLGLEHISHFPLLNSFPSYKIRYQPLQDFLEPLVWVKRSSSVFPHWFSYNIAHITLAMITYYLSSLPLHCCPLHILSNYVISTWMFPGPATVPTTWKIQKSRYLTVHLMGV